jgi:hypothetical protein
VGIRKKELGNIRETNEGLYIRDWEWEISREIRGEVNIRE